MLPIHTLKLRTEERATISRDFDVSHTIVVERKEKPAILLELNPHFTPDFVARRLKDASCMGFTTKGRHYVISIRAGTRARRHR